MFGVLHLSGGLPAADYGLACSGAVAVAAVPATLPLLHVHAPALRLAEAMYPPTLVSQTQLDHQLRAQGWRVGFGGVGEGVGVIV
jgi:hypothetical protein